MPYRVLMVHNYYRSIAPSGEDNVFREDVKLLQVNGHEVSLVTRSSDEIAGFSLWQKALLPLRVINSRSSYLRLKAAIGQLKPEIVHVCNTFPLFSPSIYRACRDMGVPVVQTIQNFRPFCAAGGLLRGDEICEECLVHGRMRALKHGCYQGSRLRTLPVVLMQWLHHGRGTWRKLVDVYIAATEFARRKLIEAGLPETRVCVRPNFSFDSPDPCDEHGGYVIFTGRLEAGKGVRTLLSAWQELSQVPLKVLGDGPLRSEVEAAANRQGSSLDFVGHRSRDECIRWLRGAMFMVMPSHYYENFPMTILEAFACGKAVVASRRGAMAEIVEDGRTGLLFEPGNPGELAEKVKWLVGHPSETMEMGRVARLRFEELYSAERSHELLMGIYAKAMARHSSH